MLGLPRRYRPAIPIVAVFVAAVILEWSHAHGPREQTYAAAPQIPAPAASQPPTVSGGNGEKTNKTDVKGYPDIARDNSAVAPNSVPPKGLTFAPSMTVNANPSAAKGENDSSRDYINYALIALGVIVAFFTYRVIKRQADIMARTLTQMGKDAELARDEFNATFRPHLIVRNVHAIDANPGDEITIKFELINNGSSRATVVASDFEINFVREVETFRNLHLPKVGEPPKNWIGKIDLIPSQVYRGIFKPDRKWQTHHFHDSRNLGNGFFWGGKILYQDRRGNQRRLGVYRRLDVASRRFRPVGDPEFEYDD